MLNSAKNEICSAYEKIKKPAISTFFVHSRNEHEIFPANKY